MASVLSKSFFIPPPALTESNLPDQSGKVHIVTGGYAGVGLGDGVRDVEAGNLYLAAETARCYGKQGIIIVAWNPGNLRTELQPHCPWYHKAVLWLLFHPAVYGTYTELYARWSPDITQSQNGAYVVL
ncbi:hypothetical protein MMC21_007443 [Puttea exsequens]|nr:hypothetical protein [Puttea exsequens]